MQSTRWAARAAAVARVDLDPGTRPPSAALVALATVVSVGASLGADAGLARAGTAVFPSTIGYAHFRFADYATLTTIGVVAAGVAWPAVTRITSEARWVFCRLAMVVSLVLLLPDVWLLAAGQPAKAVAVLALMHLAIAVITYNLLVRVAPVPAGPPTAPDRPDHLPSGLPAADRVRVDSPGRPATGPRRWRRAPWIAMAVLVGLDFVLGIVALVAVPVGRPDGWVPTAGRGVYLAHAVVGLPLGVGAALLLLAHLRSERVSLYSALIGLGGVAFGAVGGVLAVYKPDRVLGMGLMLLGSLVAFFAYLVPVGFADDPADALPRTAPGAASEPGGGGTGWNGGGDSPLLCPKRHRRALGTPTPTTGLDAEGVAAVRLAASLCPLCPDRILRPIGADWICGCCETVYHQLPDEGDGPNWMVAPGRRVVRL